MQHIISIIHVYIIIVLMQNACYFFINIYNKFEKLINI